MYSIVLKEVRIPDGLEHALSYQAYKSDIQDIAEKL
jgi:hypothetical protein